MPKVMPSVPDPVSFTFDNGAVVVTSVVDSASENHLITCVSERNTVDWRRENRIPDSDDIQAWLTRKRSDTSSTTHSDSHISNKNRLGEIAE